MSVPARFEVLEELASAVGTRLVRARDTVLQREVFLERAEGDPAPGGEAGGVRERRLREARALARVRHPAVQGLLEVLETPEGPLLVLEPVAGETLARRLEREKRLPAEDVVSLGLALAGALEVVHAAGVLHRGLDATCVRLDATGRATLTGFRFAKPTPGDAAGATSTFRSGPGTLAADGPSHPAPEQVALGQDSPRADLFGLGWVLFEALTGEPPFRGNQPLEWRVPADARVLAPQAPPALARLLALCLSASPAQRPADAAALRRALEELRGSPAAAAVATHAPSPARAPRRWLWPAAAVAAAAALAWLLLGGSPFRNYAREIEEQQKRTALVHQGALLERPALTDTYEHRYALLIGIDAYAHGYRPLATPRADVEAIGAVLKSQKRAPPWVVQTLVDGDATRQNIKQSLAWVRQASRVNDQVLVYFAGHGVRGTSEPDQGYLVPVDGDAAGDPDDSLLPFRWLVALYAEQDAAKHILVVLDCCESGLFLTDLMAMKGSAVEHPVRLTPPGPGADALALAAAKYCPSVAHVALSSTRGEPADDGSGHSPFARAFLAALGDDGILPSEKLKVKIDDAFGNRAGQMCVRAAGPLTNLGGDFVFLLDR